MEKKKIKIGLIGLGTVGTGVYKTLEPFEDIEVAKIAVKNINKPRNIEGFDSTLLTDNPFEVVQNPDIDIVVELIGGLEPAFDLIAEAIKNGKQVLITTHNPAILDGLNLNDRQHQYLYVVSRNDEGKTQAKRILMKESSGAPRMMLSEMWMKGLIGGIPNNF